MQFSEEFLYAVNSYSDSVITKFPILLCHYVFLLCSLEFYINKTPQVVSVGCNGVWVMGNVVVCECGK